MTTTRWRERRAMIYLDHAATTMIEPQVLTAMKPYMRERFGNASTYYEVGAESRKAVEYARKEIADSLDADPEEIFFTSGGTESDNWALKGTMEAYKNKGRHLIVSSFEHHAIGNTCEYLKKQGYQVTYVSVDRQGKIRLDELEHAIRPDTVMISIMCANNEIGTIQDMREIGCIAKRNHVLFHTDAVQAYGQIPIDVKNWNISLLSASSHKFYGPKGCGFLYIKKGVRTMSMIQGGSQERGFRAGTENVPGIVGMAYAAKLSYECMDEVGKRERMLRDWLARRLCEELPGARAIGSMTDRLPGNLNMYFPGIEATNLVLLLDEVGICVSAGSACTSRDTTVSHVLRAIGLTDRQASSCIRITLGRHTTFQELNIALQEIIRLVKMLQKG